MSGWTIPDVHIDWTSEMAFEDLQRDAPEFLEAAGITSWQQIAELVREGRWIHPDWKRSTPDKWSLVQGLR